jgi:hypothetical protein
MRNLNRAALADVHEQVPGWLSCPRHGGVDGNTQDVHPAGAACPMRAGVPPEYGPGDGLVDISVVQDDERVRAAKFQGALREVLARRGSDGRACPGEIMPGFRAPALLSVTGLRSMSASSSSRPPSMPESPLASMR